MISNRLFWFVVVYRGIITHSFSSLSGTRGRFGGTKSLALRGRSPSKAGGRGGGVKVKGFGSIGNKKNDAPKKWLRDEVGTEGMSFHTIGTDYPGLQVLHTSPDVFVIDNFFSDDECDRLVEKARPNLLPCLTIGEKTGIVQPDETRTSTNANMPRREVPTIVRRLCSLLKCEERQLETLQILRYEQGQYFYPHKDGFQGPATANGFKNSARLVTVFCYLNTVKQGGETRFTEIDIDIHPKKGMLVLHFPTTLDYQEDARTEHEGVAAVDEKWLFVTWVWKDSRTDKRYAETNFPLLTQDRI
jgi:prolyl 4-hydroxylase